MTRGTSLVLKILAALGVLALVIWNGLVDESFIKDDSLAKFALLAVTGMAVFGDSLMGAVIAFRQRGELERRRDIQKALIPLLREISRREALVITVIGGSVFVVKRSVWTLWLRPRLARVERFRLSDIPQESRVTWTKGKGAIGHAWKRGEIKHVDWRPVQEKWGNGRIASAQDFAQVPTEDHGGLTFEEFINIVDKYAIVLAVPLLAPGAKCVGVLAVDVPIGGIPAGKSLNDQSVVESAVGASAVIRNVL